jgi:hypothetical protein
LHHFPVRASVYNLDMLRSLLLLVCCVSLARADAPRVLFVRGGDGTGGFLESKDRKGKTEQLADITNAQTFGGNHGWATLARELRAAGFELDQILEGPVEKPAPIDMKVLTGDKVDIVVFGSNNVIYSKAQADAFWDYIARGGSALFISDANFGPNWWGAPNSDQSLLDRAGVVVNQDHGTYALKRDVGDFIAPDHPVLTGVNAFDGEGVSPVQLPEQPVEGFKVTPIVRAKGKTRENPGDKQGKTRDVTDRDCALLIIEHGKGRVACHFDRNTFFNLNGAGTSIERHDNKQYALNLFNWLARREKAQDPK